MKKTCILLLILLLVSAIPVAASDQFSGFKEFADGESLKPFARDLGSVLGAATFHNGRNLGFSGFDVGVRGGLQLRPSAGNKILRDRGVKTFGLPWVQAEIGLPFRLDGYIRGVSYQGVTIAGGGLRYGFRKSADKAKTPQFLIAWSGHSVSHKYFSASHLGLNLIGSIRVKWITPYVGVGADRTHLVVRCEPDRDATLQGADVTTTEPRFTVGASVRPKAYLYLHGAYTRTHETNGFDTGVGIRF
ncbi:hypothetical protein ACFL2T_06930 [Elusimicrobiota bacterium]